MCVAMEIIEANEDHLESVNEFLQRYFFTREPLGIRFGIDPVKDTDDWLSQVTRPLLLQKVKIPNSRFTKFRIL